MPRLHLSSSLGRLVKQPTEGFLVNGSNVFECLAFFVQQNLKLQPYLYQNETELQPFLNVYLNGKDVRFLSEQELNVKENDAIEIIAALAGG